MPDINFLAKMASCYRLLNKNSDGGNGCIAANKRRRSSVDIILTLKKLYSGKVVKLFAKEILLYSLLNLKRNIYIFIYFPYLHGTFLLLGHIWHTLICTICKMQDKFLKTNVEYLDTKIDESQFKFYLNNHVNYDKCFLFLQDLCYRK